MWILKFGSPSVSFVSCIGIWLFSAAAHTIQDKKSAWNDEHSGFTSKVDQVITGNNYYHAYGFPGLLFGR
ncbi:MAG: hypothetical protein BGO69_06660 [Bacteroidetes bacterium 46-16]|nr:MAG: hypothetical protein BGO69_06660 [Bacteroidetes bacterium 46-16]